MKTLEKIDYRKIYFSAFIWTGFLVHNTDMTSWCNSASIAHANIYTATFVGCSILPIASIGGTLIGFTLTICHDLVPLADKVVDGN